MYWLHVAVLPALVVLVLALRLRLAARRLPARLPARGGGERSLPGLPLAAVAVRALGLFLVTTGVVVLLGGLVAVDPLWTHGPSSTSYASAGSQPDWYTGFLDGALRLVPPGWEVSVLGGTVPLAVLIPQAVVGGFLATIVLWPFLEARATHDRVEHQLLDRPRDRPVRTPLGVAGIVFFTTLWSAGATDLVTTRFGIAFEHQVIALRALLVLGPLIAFQVTRQLCLALVARDREVAAYGVETGRIVRSPDGGYSEIHAPIHDRPPIAIRSRPGHAILTPDRRDRVG
jgi:ubiquinol-cytochrome c reductase cytochrome b subunit